MRLQCLLKKKKGKKKVSFIPFISKTTCDDGQGHPAHQVS